MIKVLVVDDHESMRESLERLFEAKEGYSVVGGISCADYAMKLCAEKKTRPCFYGRLHRGRCFGT